MKFKQENQVNQVIALNIIFEIIGNPDPNTHPDSLHFRFPHTTYIKKTLLYLKIILVSCNSVFLGEGWVLVTQVVNL
jgi:hypothetical protein